MNNERLWQIVKREHTTAEGRFEATLLADKLTTYLEKHKDARRCTREIAKRWASRDPSFAWLAVIRGWLGELASEIEAARTETPTGAMDGNQ